MQEPLIKQLQNQEEGVFGQRDFRISSNINNNLKPVADILLNRIPAYMPEYTLHNIKHCETILENIRKILPKDVNLNIVELTILIISVYLHDIGMVINNEDAENIKSSPEFKELFIEFEANVNESEILTEFIRRNHVERSLNYVDLFKNEFSTYKINFEFNGIDISDWVKNVILSHAYDVSFLENDEKFPVDELIDEYRVNIRYISILLRLGDILDFDIFRTPYFLYKHINPGNKISINEWNKHLSITGKDISFDKIEFSAKCTSARLERTVRNFVSWIEEERKNSINILNKTNNNYKLNLFDSVKLICRNDGSYIYSDLSINLDYDKVLNILMGTELYESPDVFIRELIQNCYDACKYRREALEKAGEEYNPKVNIKFSLENLTLVIEDNGIGIDIDVFKNYLITIGKSYYKSKNFQSQQYRFSPISNFGIGIISCFMVSDSIEIESLKYTGSLTLPTPIHYILNLDDKFTEQRKGTKTTFGTKITLKLRPDYIDKLENKSIIDIINNNMSYQEIPIVIDIDNEITILDSTGIEIPEDYESIKDVLIYKIEGYDWIEGFITIYQGQHQGLIDRGKISQQCFTIVNDTMELIPSWITFGSAFIDIRPPKKLHLKASRSKIHQDSNYNDLKNFIMEFIINKFKNELDTNTLHSYIDGKSLLLGKSRIEYDFLISNIYFYSIDKELKYKQIFYKNIINKQKGKNIAIVHTDLINNRNITSRWDFMFSKYDMVLAYTNTIYFLYGFVQPYTEKINIITTGISGLTYVEINIKDKLDNRFEDYTMNKNARRYYTEDITEVVYQGKNDTIFCTVGNMQYNIVEIHINYNHKLGRILKRLNSTILVKRFVGSFESNISQAIVDGKKLDAYVNYNGKHYFNVDNRAAYSLKSIKFMKIIFIETLNFSLLNDLLIPLKNAGHIEENPTELLLTKNDFPDWWISD